MLKIYASVPARYSACNHYRIVTPLRAMYQQSLPVTLFIDRPEEEASQEERLQRFFGSDIALMYQPMSPALGQMIDHIESFRPRRDSKGEWRWPPSVVIDTDDDIFNVEPLNSAFARFGTRSEGKTIPPNQVITHTKANGKSEVLYQDGANFSLARNLERVAEYRSQLCRADLVTCTTPLCAEYVQRETTPKRIEVIPNAIMLEDFPTHPGVRMVRKNPTEVRIMWQGGDSHYEDLLPLKDTICKLARKHHNLKWVFWGALYDWIITDMPSDRVEWHQWVDHRAYHLKLTTLDIDISIAPLSATLFNRSRSAIKWYEPSVLERPAATIAQNYGPYGAEIQDGVNGLLFNTPEEFEARVEELLGSEQRRNDLASAAKSWVLENRDARRVAKRLFDIYTEIRETKKVSMPPTADDEIPKEGEDAVHRELADVRPG